MRKTILLTLFIVALAFGVQAQQGELAAVSADGKQLGACPLKHTDVSAEISGFLSRVKVTQEFENNFSEKIEAVYVFPLPNNAAVDDLTMRIGNRIVRGKILKREEARDVYEAAKSNGQIASLLDQERPNIFTQSVANILPGEKISIEISYVETLKYEAGAYQFVFPMVVGPRYIPGSATGRSGGGYAPDTNQVPDASKITPMPAKTRAGHDISISVTLDAGVPLEGVASKSHEIESQMLSASSYVVKLKDEKTIPNKDFILRYDVSGKRITDAVLTHRDEKGGYFTLILQPPDEPRAQDITPKEIVFVLDTSGSMSGFPIDKAKEAMRLALDNLNAQDTFNLITFAGDTSVLFEKPVPATRENLRKAQAFLESRQGGGGTEMMKAIRAALDPSDAQDHIRVVCFMTDGYVGNDLEIVGEIQKHPNARVFSFGIGQSVNRFLLDKMAEEGRGEVEYVSLNDDGSAAAKRFDERVRSPLLTDISLDYGNLQVADVYPKRINDLFSAKPLIVHGRYTKGGNGVIKIRGKSSGREVVREIAVNFPENEPAHDVLATLWARTKIDDLTAQDYAGAQIGSAKMEVKDAITSIGLEYRLLTQYTSFVAVEEQVVTDGGKPRRIEVPVEMPEGVSRAGVFGEEERPTGSLAVPIAGGIISTRNIQSLPINGRQFGNLMQVTAGRRNVKEKGKNQTPNSPANVTKVELSKSDANEVITVDGASADSVSPSISMSVKATNLPKPVFPSTEASGAVNVEVALDASGKVTAAKAVSGDKVFYMSAETAAKNAKFELPQVPFEIAKVYGIIAYNFVAKDKTVTVAPDLQNIRVVVKPNKFQTSVKALVERVKNNQPKPSADEAKFVANGKADLIVRVKDLKPETISELKKLGFEVLTEMTSANAVVGRINVEKIAALAEIESVIYISPQIR